MKTKIIAILILGLWIFCGNAAAVDWKVTNQATIAWDAVITLGDGSALPAGNLIKYKVYLANAITDPNKQNPATLGETDQLEYLITLNAEGKFIPGVSAVRYDETGAAIDESAINWADVNGESTPNPFGLVHYIPPAMPMNLR